MKLQELRKLIREEIKNSKTSTLSHKTVAGENKKIDIDLESFDNFLMSLKPLVGEDIKIDHKVREDILSKIVKYLGGYNSLGGGSISLSK